MTTLLAIVIGILLGRFIQRDDVMGALLVALVIWMVVV